MHGFWAAWGGWTLDGMDWCNYALFLSAVVNRFIGDRYGWRAIFALGGAPPFLLAFIYYGVKEPGRWERQHAELGKTWTAGGALLSLFSPQYRQRTLLNSTYILISIVGLWAGSVNVPAATCYLAAKEGVGAAEGVRLASYGTMLLAFGTILGCLLLPMFVEWLGRRAPLALYFMLVLVFIWTDFGHVFYLQNRALSSFMLRLLSSGSEAPSSPCALCGSRGNIAPSAAQARSPFQPPWAALWKQQSRSLWVPTSGAFKRSVNR